MSRDEGPGIRTDEPVVPDASTQQRFVEALQELDTIVWEMDARTWRFTHVSDRAVRMFGYPLERWIEEGFWQEVLVDPEDRDWCTGYCLSSTNDNRNHAFVYRARTANGRLLWIKDVVRVIPERDGTPALLRGVMVDVTAERAGMASPDHLALDYDAPELEPLRRILIA